MHYILLIYSYFRAKNLKNWGAKMFFSMNPKENIKIIIISIIILPFAILLDFILKKIKEYKEKRKNGC